MKFQNSSIHGFKVTLCIKKRDERTDGRTDGRTNNPEAICPSNFFEVGGIKMFRISNDLLWPWANFAQISYEASLGWGNERLLKRSRLVDQDGRHAHIW